MLIFGHTGITLGVAVLLKSTLARSYSLQPKVNKVMEYLESNSNMHSTQNEPPSGRARWLTFLEKIDTRLLFIGSLLPDIIDKPVGQFFFRDTFSNGRLFSHSVLFLLLISLAGLYLYRSHRKTWLFVFSFGTFTHLICDQMWFNLRTLLWPLFGFAFEKIDLTHWMLNLLHSLRTNPTVYVPELVGAVILTWFILMLVRKRKVYAFIKNGRAL